VVPGGDLAKVMRVRKYYSQSCEDTPKTRRDFRFLTMDNPCSCGIQIDESDCLNTRVWWKSERVKPTHIGSNKYVAHLEKPANGQWGAFFVDVVFRNEFDKDEEEEDDQLAELENEATLKDMQLKFDRKHPLHLFPGWLPKTKAGHLRFTSEVSIVPDIFPYDDCYMETCKGTLL
jgi:hypothetical protein